MYSSVSNPVDGRDCHEDDEESEMETYLGYGEGHYGLSNALSSSDNPQSESELLDMILHECGADETKNVPATKVIKVLQKKCLSPDQGEILEILKEMEERDEIIDCSSLQAISIQLGEFIEEKRLRNCSFSMKDSCSEDCSSTDFKNEKNSESHYSSFFSTRRRSIADLSEEIKSLLHQNNKLAAENAKLKKQIGESDDIHQHLIQENDEFKKNIKSIEKRLLEKNKELQIQNDDLKICLQAFEESKIMLESKLKTAQQSNNSLDNQLKNAQKNLQQVQTDLNFVKKREKQLFTSLTDEKQVAQKLMEEKHLLEEQLIEKSSQNEELQQALNENTEINKVVLHEKDELEKKLSTLLNHNTSFVDSVACSTLGSGEPLKHVESLENENVNDEIAPSNPRRESLNNKAFYNAILPLSNHSLSQEIEEAQNFDMSCIKQIGKDIQDLKSQVSEHHTLLQSMYENCHLSFPAVMGSQHQLTTKNGNVTFQQTSIEHSVNKSKNVSCFFKLFQSKRRLPLFSFKCEFMLLLIIIVVKLFIYSYFFTCGYKQYYSSVFEKSLDIILWPFLNIQNEKPPV